MCMAALTSPQSTCSPGQKARRESMKVRVILVGEFMLTSTSRGPLEMYRMMAV